MLHLIRSEPPTDQQANVSGEKTEKQRELKTNEMTLQYFIMVKILVLPAKTENLKSVT